MEFPSSKPIKPVAVGPGAIAFTVMPYGNNIFAKPSVIPSNPHFETPYGDHAGSEPLDEEMTKMWPLFPFSFNSRANSRQAK